MQIPILQVRQPWAWAYCAGRIDRHGVPRADDYRGPRAVVSSNTNSYRAQTVAWMRENGIEAPENHGLPLGAIIGFVWSDGCVGRADLGTDAVLDHDERFFLRLRDPFPVPAVKRSHWTVDRGLTVADAILFATPARTPLSRAYVETFRAIERGESLSVLNVEPLTQSGGTSRRRRC